MQPQFTAEVVLSLFAALVSLVVAVGLWRRRGTPGAPPLAVFCAAVAVWTAGNAGQAAATTLPSKLLAVNVQYLGLVVVAPAWFAFAAVYTGRRGWLTRRTLALLAIHPILTVALVWSNDYHHLVRLSADLVTAGGVVGLERTFGPWFWFSLLYSNLLLGAGTLLLLRALVRMPRVYRGQVIAVIGGTLAPWFGSIAFYGGFVDLEPEVFFAVTAVGFWVALTRYGLFDVTPVARDAVIRGLPDPMVVVDPTGRITDANPAAVRLFGGDDVRAVVGRRAADVVTDPALRTALTGTDAPDVISTGTAEGQRHFAPHVVEVPDRDAAGGRVVVLRDVTDVVEGRREAERRNRQLEHVTDVLSHDIRSPLNVAAGFFELALAGEEGAADRVRTAHRRMEELVDETVRATRAGTPTSRVVPVRVAAAAEHAWRNVDTGDATLRTAGDLTVLADDSQLRTLFENLFRNAVEHGPGDGRGTADLTVEVGPLEGRGGFYVADDGVGIPPAERRAVFDRGRSGDGGTGLGLAIIEGVADVHGWGVRAVERAGGGARFEVFDVTVSADDASGKDTSAVDADAADEGNPVGVGSRDADEEDEDCPTSVAPTE